MRCRITIWWLLWVYICPHTCSLFLIWTSKHHSRFSTSSSIVHIHLQLTIVFALKTCVILSRCPTTLAPTLPPATHPASTTVSRDLLRPRITGSKGLSELRVTAQSLPTTTMPEHMIITRPLLHMAARTARASRHRAEDNNDHQFVTSWPSHEMASATSNHK
ncbi:hypothetical protein F5Y18DRAFT_69764 [Xylariaceae sp. FL1019]|nr:hypothetical protein F5Y18DRAFT_69764 [Xylariaceae sp. FL1019]